MSEWTDESVDLKTFAHLCDKIVDTEAEVDRLEKQVKKLNDDIKADRDKLLMYMQESGLTRLDGKNGHVEVDEIISVRQPATREDKAAFFKYLEDQDIFFDMVNVNSRTLSSWAKKEIKAKESESGLAGWVPPGLQAPYREFKLKPKLKKA